MSENKILRLRELLKVVSKSKKLNKKVVLCHGVFDLIHPGHIRHLKSSKSYGDVLIVTIIADKFVNKGPGRPIFNEFLRAEVLASLSFVDYISIVPHETAAFSIKKIAPDVYSKGGEHKNKHTNPLTESEEKDELLAVKSVGGTTKYTDDIVFSSSHLINQYLSVYPKSTKQYLTQFGKKYSDAYIIQRLKSLSKMSILVIGDAIIDQYFYTTPLGKSTKEPITVHKYLKEENFAGGALACANHCHALSKNITLVTLLGKKQSYESFIKKHLEKGITTKFFYSPGVKTTVKRRFIDENTRQKLFQVSYINDAYPFDKLENSIIDFLKLELGKYDLVIVNDFGHGFISQKMIKIISTHSKFLALNVQANSANFGFNIVTKYPKADYVCIDDTELRLAMHDKRSDLESLITKISSKLKSSETMVTKGKFGSILYNKKFGMLTSPSLTDRVVDRVGAGDALFALSSPLVAAGFERDIVSFIGNIAGALQVMTLGNKKPIQLSDMTKFITRLLK